MKIQPFALLGDAQYASLLALFNAQIESWLGDWIKQPPTATLTIASIARCFEDYRSAEGARFTDTLGENWAVCSLDKPTSRQLCEMMLAGQDLSASALQPADLVSGLSGSALLDLMGHLLPPAEGEYSKSQEDTIGACVPASAFLPGNEALHLRIEISGLCLQVWLPVRPFLPRVAFPSPALGPEDERLVAPREALGNQRMGFRVMLGSADLTLGSVANLRVGDVIRLDKELHDPLSLIFNHSPAKFAGYLGRKQGCYSFQIDALLR